MISTFPSAISTDIHTGISFEEFTPGIPSKMSLEILLKFPRGGRLEIIPDISTGFHS